jgi:hypothetical protein
MPPLAPEEGAKSKEVASFIGRKVLTLNKLIS